MGFRLIIGFTGHLRNVTTNNYDSITELPIPKTTVTTSRINSFQFAVFISRRLVTDPNNVPRFRAHVLTGW
jgi:hypothetical protein